MSASRVGSLCVPGDVNWHAELTIKCPNDTTTATSNFPAVAVCVLGHIQFAREVRMLPSTGAGGWTRFTPGTRPASAATVCTGVGCLKVFFRRTSRGDGVTTVISVTGLVVSFVSLKTGGEHVLIALPFHTRFGRTSVPAVLPEWAQPRHLCP